MGEPLTQNSAALKCSLAVRTYSTAGNKQLQHQHPDSFWPRQPLFKPTMKHQAEINRFALFLFCTLVPLGSLAPTEKSKTTSEQMQKHFVTRLEPLASMLEMEATILFKNYNVCSPVTSRTLKWLTADCQVKDMVKKIPECPAFDADCCTFHVFHNILENLKSDIEVICGEDLTSSVTANINQLNVVLSEGAAFYTCKGTDLLQVDHGQGMKMAQKMMYIWQVLQKYEQFMQNTTKIYSSAEM